jgi:hypothetical protein
MSNVQLNSNQVPTAQLNNQTSTNNTSAQMNLGNFNLGNLNIGSLLNNFMGNTSNMPTQTNNPTAQTQQTQNSQSPPNPLAGINIMSMFGQMQENGGMGQLMSLSLGEMLE